MTLSGRCGGDCLPAADVTPHHVFAPISSHNVAGVLQQRQPPAKKSSANLLVDAFRGKGGTTDAPAKKPPRKKPSQRQPRPLVMVLPDHFGSIHSPNENDVLCGRGGRINSHSGNVQYREMVNDTKERYLDERTQKLEKAHIAAEIVYAIRSMNPPGRFLVEKKDGSWTEIGDARAFKKVGQALREDAPELRDSDQTNTPSPKKKLATVKNTAPPETIASASRTVSKRGGRIGSLPGGGMDDQIGHNYIPTAPSPVFSEQPIAPRTLSEFQAPDETFGRRNISGAAAQKLNEFEAPQPTAADRRSQDELFGRTFYPPPINDRDSSLLSGVSCQSAMSGISQISGLTDPISAVSESMQQMVMTMTAVAPANDDMSWNQPTKATSSVASLSMGGDDMSQLSEQLQELFKDVDASSNEERKLWEV